MKTLVPMLMLLVLLVCFLGALFFLAGLMVAPLSPKVFQRLRRHPVIHAVWGTVSILVVWFYWYVAVAYPMWWPPSWIERQLERKAVKCRVEKIGGWEAVRLGCETVVADNPDGFSWFPAMSSNWVMHFELQERYNWYLATNLDYGPLPPAVAALRPFEVRYNPREGCVIIQVFGMHRTGGHDTPYLAYELDTSTNSANYEHGLEYEGTFGYRPFAVRRIAKGIYELHY